MTAASSSGVARGPVWPTKVLAGTVGLALVSIGVVLVASLWWPRAWDGSVLEYAAWAVDHGARPYRDVFEMNYPGSYLFYGIGQQVLGSSDRSFRIRDVVVLLVALVALWRLLRSFPWPTAPVAVVLVTVQYLVVGGVGMALQRDWLVAVATLLALLALSGERTRPRLVAAGAALGAAATIKPNAALMIVALPAAFAAVELAAAARRGGGRIAAKRIARRELARFGWIALGAAGLIAVVVAWVVAAGGWSDFVWINRHYLPRYGRLDGGGMETTSLGASLFDTAVLTLKREELATMVLGAAVVGLRRRPGGELRLLLVLSVVGVTGFVAAVAAGKAWDYHQWTWLLAALCFLAVGTGDVATGRWTTWSRAPRRLVVATAIGFLVAYAVWLARVDAPSLLLHHRIRHLAFLLSPLPIAALAVLDLVSSSPRGRDVVRRPWMASAGVLLVAGVLVVNAASLLNLARPNTVTEVPKTEHQLGLVLRDHLRPGDRLQILGTVAGHEAALEAEAPPATSFIYDFHFFHDVGSPETTELRERFIREWEADPPELVLVSEESWSHRRTYEDLESFPELVDELAEYRVVFRNEEATILERRDRP